MHHEDHQGACSKDATSNMVAASCNACSPIHRACTCSPCSHQRMLLCRTGTFANLQNALALGAHMPEVLLISDNCSRRVYSQTHSQTVLCPLRQALCSVRTRSICGKYIRLMAFLGQCQHLPRSWCTCDFVVPDSQPPHCDVHFDSFIVLQLTGQLYYFFR